MAFIKLFPHEGAPWLAVDCVVERLRDEFIYFHADRDEGRDHVGGMIAAVVKLPEDLPGRQEQLDNWKVAQESAIVVEFGNFPACFARTCVIAASELFFGRRDEVHGPARPFVDRAASILGYKLFCG